ncbi:thioredoxin [Phocaeicola sp.]|jgi:thioredoxin|uniref:thioredoxin n=1 Tax=Phocaeicola sp. TaxID=2773926 RepID=UPI00283DA159|nr:thioredoxin [Phocaeicola sp.]MDR3796193.1 thioredoxin [Phocaeicola sp.]
MKRILLMILTAALLTPACGSNAAKDPQAKAQESTAEQSNVTHLTKAEFLTKVYNYEKNPKEWKYEGKLPAIVDFYATWCGPCKMVAPILEELAGEYKGKIVVYKIDTDKEPELSAAFGIRSIPTLLFIPAEGTPQVSQGAMPKDALKKAIDEFLLGNKK